MPKSEIFKSRFAKLIESLDKKVTECYKVIGIHYNDFCSARLYGIYPSVKNAVRIADFFNVSLDYLLGLSDDERFVRSETPIKFSERLKELQLAKPSINLRYDTKVHPSNLKRWEQKDIIPLKWQHVFGLAQFYEISLDYLFCRTNTMKL